MTRHQKATDRDGTACLLLALTACVVFSGAVTLAPMAIAQDADETTCPMPCPDWASSCECADNGQTLVVRDVEGTITYTFDDDGLLIRYEEGGEGSAGCYVYVEPCAEPFEDCGETVACEQ